MGIAFVPGPRSPEDLTARARIRDAALVQFAEKGIRGATIKSIAEQAGVSPGLVQHHFGTKDKLREACDAAVVEIFRRRTAQGALTGEITNRQFMADLFEASPLLIRYLARAAVDGGPAADAVLDELAAGAQEFLTHTWPERFPPGSRQARDAAAVMCAMHSGVLLLHDQLARQMGSSLEGTDSTRIGLAMVELYAAMGEFATSDAATQMTDAIVQYRDSKEDTR
ncbi:TetR/AcrR family transcriptional regulator [Mycolicibacterium sp. GF69]|uniref:TetR/AcrR family transcriptional regulator n=1 Tax=Mycolicibacterium sp. GF69 TaxID=2267251 RepID=UPI000DCE3B80|nr:TetR/AcrR family transcriptional regulator [Mycolicibacterium sp. GF69]RAV13143.1 TetR/AcrR family transcriptional regulator [Mycolicibacterium sp. GF69]